MLAIYKRELKSYFTSMMGYVFVAFVLVVVGIYFAAYNLNAYPLIGYTLYNVTFLFLILVPILTMRSLAEEQRNKTDQLLYTSPVSLLGIVIGKFLALISVFGIPVLVICFYPQILGQYGTVNMPMSYLAIFGFFLLGCAYIAIGMFISSITESQIIAAVISFVVLMASYQMEGIASFFFRYRSYFSDCFFSFISFNRDWIWSGSKKRGDAGGFVCIGGGCAGRILPGKSGMV